MKNALKIVFIITLAVMIGGVASAASITGTVNLGSPVANIIVPDMNSATFVGIPSFTVTTPATGSFLASLGSTGTAIDFITNGPIAGFLTFDGFTIDVVSFLGGPDVWTMANIGQTTIAGFSFVGLAHKAGYDDTTIFGTLTTQYPDGYGSGKTVAWSANLIADNPVPEPGTYAMLGAGLVVIAMLRHRRSFRKS